MKEDEMIGWHHQFDGHKFEQAPGDDEGQGSLMLPLRLQTHSAERLNPGAQSGQSNLRPISPWPSITPSQY